MMFEAGERISVKVEREDDDWSVDDPVGTSQSVEVKREPGVGRKKAKRKKLNPVLFKCDHLDCQYSTNRKDNLFSHAAVHSDERPHKCHKCEKSFKTSEYLKKHLQLHSEETPFQCDECERAFKFKNYLNFHQSTHKNRDVWYNCHECDYSSPHEDKFIEHETIHVKTNPLKCDRCDCSFKSKRRLARHFQAKHSAMGPWRCDHPDCQFTTLVKSSIKQHKNLVHEFKKSFICEECQRGFKKKDNLKRHSLIHTVRIKPFKCQKCQFSSSTKSVLHFHERRKHVNEKDHKCDECGASYNLKDDLDKHKLNHNDALKKLKCHLCPFKTISNTCLKSHLLSHKNKGRYKCDECDRSFNASLQLKRHRFTHSKTKNLRCGECDYRTNNPWNLKRHQLVTVHSGENCDHCGLILRGQSDSAIHRDAHRPCSVPLRRLSDSAEVTLHVNAPPFLRRVKIELNDDVIKKENV